MACTVKNRNRLRQNRWRGIDATRHVPLFPSGGGINGAAQAVHDLGKKANPRTLAKAASAFENSAVRRLGYLLERFGHVRQANVLRSFAEKAKSFKDLDPAAKPIIAALRATEEKRPEWKLVINVPVEIDA